MIHHMNMVHQGHSCNSDAARRHVSGWIILVIKQKHSWVLTSSRQNEVVQIGEIFHVLREQNMP